MTFSRRRVLAALAAAGGAGALTGSGTAAMFTDSERLGGSLTTGVVDLAVAYEVLDGPGAGDTGVIDGPRVDLPLGGLGAESASGSTLLTFALPQGERYVNTPAALWLATDCLVPEPTALGEAIRLTLSYADCETGASGDLIESGTLREVAERLRLGTRIDGDPTTPADDCLVDEVCLLAEYDLAGYVGTESVDLPLFFTTVQCRHDGTPANPFANREARDCLPGVPCTCCRTLGKLEFEDDTQPGLGDSSAAPGVYSFSEGSTEYGVEIYDTTTKDGGAETTGVALRLVRLDGDGNAVPGAVPALCNVLVKAGTGSAEYGRADGTLPTDTAGLPGSDADGVVSAPDGRGISHVTVCICTPEPEESCPGCVDNSTGGGPPTDSGGGPPGAGSNNGGGDR